MYSKKTRTNMIYGGVFGLLLFAAMSVGDAGAVPIDLTNAPSEIVGESRIRLEGIETLGSNYWAEFEWNENTNKFDVAE